MGGHGHEEGVALDHADGPAFFVHHRDGQNVRLGLEPLIDPLALGVGSDRRNRIRQVEKRGQHGDEKSPRIMRGDCPATLNGQ